MTFKTALIYDYDGTLAPGNIQEHSFIPELKIPISEFWAKVGEIAKEHDADQILVYMWRMLEEARARQIKITREAFREYGKNTPIFEGLTSWFKRINEYGKERGLEVEHYIVSSGTHEMIEGSPISREFKRIYASRFIYGEDGEALWPGVSINYTNKTQFLFRINKGIDNTWDNEQINRYMPEGERPIPFSRMIFFGDGETDIPAMKMVRHQGGHSIAVFDPKKFREPKTQEHVHRLIAEDRAHFVVPADYTEGSHLDLTVKGVLGRVGRGVR